jgi:glutaredoxin-related protein
MGADSTTVLTFGKYTGNTYEQVRREDVSYCNWILKKTDVKGKLKEFQNWIKLNSTKVTCEMCNGSGKMCVA